MENISKLHRSFLKPCLTPNLLDGSDPVYGGQVSAQGGHRGRPTFHKSGRATSLSNRNRSSEIGSSAKSHTWTNTDLFRSVTEPNLPPYKSLKIKDSVPGLPSLLEQYEVDRREKNDGRQNKTWLPRAVRILAILCTLLLTWYFSEKIYLAKWEARSLRNLFGQNVKDQKSLRKLNKKCGNDKECPSDYFAFKIISGAANVVGPSICFENTMLMSNVKNNNGRGLNIVLLNASTTELIKMGHFNMYSGDVQDLINFLEPMKEGTLILMASYDDPATKLNDKARELLTSFGSSYAKKIAFRDSWTFVGGKGIKNKSPFEQHLKNEKETNKYDGWPEVLELSGCIPKKMD